MSKFSEGQCKPVQANTAINNEINSSSSAILVKLAEQGISFVKAGYEDKITRLKFCAEMFYDYKEELFIRREGSLDTGSECDLRDDLALIGALSESLEQEFAEAGNVLEGYAAIKKGQIKKLAAQVLDNESAGYIAQQEKIQIELEQANELRADFTVQRENANYLTQKVIAWENADLIRPKLGEIIVGIEKFIAGANNPLKKFFAFLRGHYKEYKEVIASMNKSAPIDAKELIMSVKPLFLDRKTDEILGKSGNQKALQQIEAEIKNLPTLTARAA